MGTSKRSWYRRRGYPHFDHPISYGDAKRIVKDPNQVARHSFYPFVEFSLQTFKLKKDPVTSKLKRVGKTRPIAYASHVDSHIYSYYSLKLAKQYEKTISHYGLGEAVLAFRALGKNNIEFAANAFDVIRGHGDCYVLAFDISGFFDNLDHQILKQMWARVLNVPSLPVDHYSVYKSLANFAKVELSALYKLFGYSLNNKNTVPKRLCSAKEFRDVVRSANNLVTVNGSKKGIPQGSPLSALLSNIYMLEFDIALNEFVKSRGGHYFRYCDDILVILPPEAGEAEENFVLSEISKLKLNVNPDKTDRVRFSCSASGEILGSKALQYLGFLFDGKKVFLRSASLARYLQKMRRGVRVAKATMEKRNEARHARGDATTTLFKKTLYKRYSHIGRRNFLTYGYSAAQTMKSEAIRRQLRVLWGRLQDEINAS
ncbi:antiviral reverse transcriptase Drt2 [Massilia brevitalea]|uniref:antiviral reverse transcriptase Drt2 n=1 Tax=Massilia brevitalea TaxID=442526 RepID=UPI002738CA40|nr:antiviral reverse transcriptase Drt2 [Massilia brevitalea]